MERILALALALPAAAVLLRPEGPEARVDRAIRKGARPIKPVRVVRIRRLPAQDPSLSSGGGFGSRAVPVWLPSGCPEWTGSAAWTLDGSIQRLKDVCRKGILAAS
jgi:hypothetical protein